MEKVMQIARQLALTLTLAVFALNTYANAGAIIVANGITIEKKIQDNRSLVEITFTKMFQEIKEVGDWTIRVDSCTFQNLANGDMQTQEVKRMLNHSSGLTVELWRNPSKMFIKTYDHPTMVVIRTYSTGVLEYGINLPNLKRVLKKLEIPCFS